MSSNNNNSPELLAQIQNLFASHGLSVTPPAAPAVEAKPAKAAKAVKAPKASKAKPAKKTRTREEVLASLAKAREVAAAKRAAAASVAAPAGAPAKTEATKPATKRPVRADKTLPTPAEMLEAIYRKVVG